VGRKRDRTTKESRKEVKVLSTSQAFVNRKEDGKVAIIALSNLL